jgi:prostamide/prostaglandin F2alpha synthase
VQLHGARAEFEAAGAGLVLIGQATPRHAAHFRRRFGIELPVLADERRVSYKAIGARKATLGELLGPRIVAKGMIASARHGVIQGRTIGHPAQLGGAAVVRPDGQLTWSHLAEDASDNASIEQVLAAVREAG